MAIDILVGITSILNKAYKTSLCILDMDIRSYRLIFARLDFNCSIILYTFGLSMILTYSVVIELGAYLVCPLLSLAQTSLYMKTIFTAWSYFYFIPSI